MKMTCYVAIDCTKNNTDLNYRIELPESKTKLLTSNNMPI